MSPDTKLADLTALEVDELNAALAEEFDDERLTYVLLLSRGRVHCGLGGSSWTTLDASWDVQKLWAFAREGYKETLTP